MRVSRSVSEGKEERERNIGPMITLEISKSRDQREGQPGRTGPNCAVHPI